jgi:hypothetical protein
MLKERGLSTESFVHHIQDKMFTSEDAKHFNTRWTVQPCHAGQVRVTLPHLPHGALGAAKGTRRTMLPWYCGLQRTLKLLRLSKAARGKRLHDIATATQELRTLQETKEFLESFAKLDNRVIGHVFFSPPHNLHHPKGWLRDWALVELDDKPPTNIVYIGDIPDTIKRRVPLAFTSRWGETSL